MLLLDWNFGPVIYSEVTDGQKVMHMSLPCISTGVLKKWYQHMYSTIFVTFLSYTLIMFLTSHNASALNPINAYDDYYELFVGIVYFSVSEGQPDCILQ